MKAAPAAHRPCHPGTLSSTLTLAAGTYVVAANYPSTADRQQQSLSSGNVNVLSGVTLGDARFDSDFSFTFPSGDSSDANLGYFGPTIQVVPEPGSMALLATGAAGCLLMAVRRRK